MKKQKKQPRPRSSKLKKTLTSFLVGLVFTFFAWTTHTVNTVQLPDPGVTTELYASEVRDDLRSVFLSAIASSNSSIHLLVYTLTDQAIIRALKEKAEKGVDVKVIVDAKASPYAAQELGQRVNTLRRLGVGLMHDKILVVDNKFVWIGSANMTGDSLKTHSNLVLGMHSPALADHLIAKAESLPEAGKGDFFPYKEFQIGGQKLECYFLPDEAKNGLQRIKELIRSAKKTVRVAMFTWTRQDLAHEVIKAAKRGVKVQVVIDNNSGKGASAQIVKLLKQNGIDVHLSQGVGLLHHKFMVVDKKVLVNGSANWTKAAFGTNDDCFLVLNDLSTRQAEKLEQEWKILYADSQKVE